MKLTYIILGVVGWLWTAFALSYLAVKTRKAKARYDDPTTPARAESR